MRFPVVWVGALLVVVLVLAACGIVWLTWRRIRELRAGGIDVALRVRIDDAGRGWHLGVAHYRGEEFAWYRVLSLRSGPNWVLNRGELDIRTRREPSVAERYTMPAEATVLNLTGLHHNLELAMGPDALTGFLSWLESAPPGRSVPWAS
jgi:hypothetical protein